LFLISIDFILILGFLQNWGISDGFKAKENRRIVLVHFKKKFMSSIEKLLIRGIRSFDPDSQNIIEFSSPLTVIVGQNGTGKTVCTL
jgi:hypothetical protein